jgi:hypothetical protein
MMTTGERKLEEYLNELRMKLRGVPEAERSEIIAEIDSHIRDSAGSTLDAEAVESALQRLGGATELASLYRAQSLLTHAENSRSPWLLFTSVFRYATISIAGFFIFLGLLVGYFVTACLFLAALVKPFAPDRVGLWWILPQRELALHIGIFTSPPPQQGTELLGWWIVPIGLLLGLFVLWMTPRFGRWAIRRFAPKTHVERTSRP